MKKRIGLIITIIVAALIICLLVWRFWPHSSSSLISVDENAVTSFSAYAMVHRFENGQTYTDTYHIERTEQQGYALGEIVEILATSGYQQDFRNLSPRGVDSVGSDKNYDGRTVTLSFYTDSRTDEYVDIQFLGKSIIAVSYEGKSGFRIYHPTSHKVIDNLVEYLQTHGVKQPLT